MLDTPSNTLMVCPSEVAIADMEAAEYAYSVARATHSWSKLRPWATQLIGVSPK